MNCIYDLFQYTFIIIKVMEEVLPAVKADKDTELSLKDTKADTELSYNPGNMTMISYPDSDKLDVIVPATEGTFI